MTGNDEIRMVLLGHTGAGKSSTGNSILRRNAFDSYAGKDSRTQQCTIAESFYNNRLIKIIDTPGLFDTERSERAVSKELDKCLDLAAPGPHVFLFVISLRDRFPREAEDSIRRIEKKFGRSMYKYGVVLFTSKDAIDSDGTTFENFRQHSLAEPVRDLLSKCKNRVVVFNNNANEKEKESQLDILIKEISGIGGLNEFYRKKNCIQKYCSQACGSLAYLFSRTSKMKIVCTSGLFLLYVRSLIKLGRQYVLFALLAYSGRLNLVFYQTGLIIIA